MSGWISDVARLTSMIRLHDRDTDYPSIRTAGVARLEVQGRVGDRRDYQSSVLRV